jgi:hypothetical protein
MLSGMAITTADLILEAFAHTRSQTVAPKEAPRGASPSLDPQRVEGNKQARLPESFTLGEVVLTSSMVPPIRERVPSAKVAQGGAESVEASGVVNVAVARVYQAPLFSAAMVSRVDFSPAVVFKMVAAMCERGSSTATNTMKTEVHLEPVRRTQCRSCLQQQHVSRLCLPDLQLKGHPFHRGWWWLIIPKAFSNLLGLRGRYSYLDECY